MHVAVQMQQTFRNGAIRQQLPRVHIGAPLARVHRATGTQDLGEGVRDERLPGMAHGIGLGPWAHGPMGTAHDGTWWTNGPAEAAVIGFQVECKVCFFLETVTFTFMFYLSKHDDAFCTASGGRGVQIILKNGAPMTRGYQIDGKFVLLSRTPN